MMLGITHFNFTMAMLFQLQLQRAEWDGGEGIFEDVAHSEVLCQRPKERIAI
jgi:hypothetical protein